MWIGVWCGVCVCYIRGDFFFLMRERERREGDTVGLLLEEEKTDE